MRALLESEVLEVCVLGVPEGRKVGKVRAGQVAETLRRSNAAYRRVSAERVSEAIRCIFPIYKNAHSGAKTLKVGLEEAETFIAANAMIVRPIEHGMVARIGRALEAEKIVRQTHQPGTGFGRGVQKPPARALRRRQTLVRVEAIIWDSDYIFAHIVLPQWKPDREIRVPLDTFPASLQPRMRKGTRLVATANLAAAEGWQLQLRALEIAPEPDPADGLA